MIKPDARIIPTEDEFSAWQQHPVSQFVAAAYEKAAERQRLEWAKYLNAPIVPADLAMIRLELKTREDAYRAFTECTLKDFSGMIGEEAHGRRPPSAGASRRRQAAG